MGTDPGKAPSFLSLVGFFLSFSVLSPSGVSAFDLHQPKSWIWSLAIKALQGEPRASVDVSTALGRRGCRVVPLLSHSQRLGHRFSPSLGLC